MKNIVKGSLLVVLISGLSFAASSRFTETLPPASSAGAVAVSNGYDWSLSTMGSNVVPGFVLPSYTLAYTTTSLISSTTGQLIFCSNCSANGGKGTICVSTGTTATYQFVLSSGTACK